MHEHPALDKAFSGMQKFQNGTNSPPVDRDPDSIENLVTQTLTQALELKDALCTMRHVLLGPWPEPASEKINNIAHSPMGLVSNLREALYKLMDTQREIKEHIVMISKGVR